MALSLSFGSSGSTPQQGYLGGPTQPISPFMSSNSVSPYTKALSSTPAPNMSTVNGPRYAPPPVIPPPSTPVKKTTVNNTDGSSHVTEYHAPVAPAAQQPQYDPAGGGGHAIIPTAPTAGLLPTQPTPTAPATPTTPNTASTAPTINGLIGGATDAAKSNEAIAARAQAIADQYAPKFQALAPQIASEAGDLSTGTTPVAEGNAAIAAQVASAETTNLQNAQQAAMAGITPGLTAANQEAGALNTTAGLIPSPLLYGTFGAGTNADPQTAIQNAVSQLKSGNGGAGYTKIYNQLSSAYGPVIANQLLPALGSDFNVAQSDAQAASQASNTTTANTAQTNSYAGIYDTANTNAANYSQQRSAINAVGSQALNLLNQIPDRTSSQFANARLNDLASQFSSPEYAAFNTAVQSLQARIGQALQAGEIPTAATGNAQSIANGNLTVGALAATLQQVDKEMGSFVDTQNALAAYAKSQLGNNPSSSSSAPSSSSPTSTTTYAEAW